MAAVLLVAGAGLVVAGVAVIWWPAALIVAGVLLLAGGIDISRERVVAGDEPIVEWPEQ